METQGRYESKAQGLLILIRVAEWDRHGRHLSRGKDSKTLVLAAFFGYFLSLLAESTPSETKQGVPCEGMRIATGAVRPRNDSF